MSLVLVAALALASVAAPDEVTPRFPKGLAAMELGPPPHGLSDWSAASCERCHPSETRAWKLSGHAHARDNFVFQAALTRDDPTWCLACHAPLARSREPGPVTSDAPDEERGITCAACHAGQTAVLAPHAADSPHSLEVTAHAGGSLLCARCHEFGFPVHGAHDEVIGLSGEPAQQDTFLEWQRWQQARGDARGCLDCHGHGDHAFGGVERIEALAQAVDVDVEPGALVLRLRDVGHELPTGDVMRTLTVEASADPLFSDPEVLARFGRELSVVRGPDGTPGRTVRADHRLLPDVPERIAVPPRDAAGKPLLAWRVVYHLVSLDQEAEGMLPASSSRLVIRSGYLAPLAEAP